MTTQQIKITNFIKQKGQVTGAEISSYFGISRQALYKHIPRLLEAKIITKIGKPPKVFYSINADVTVTKNQDELTEIEAIKLPINFLLLLHQEKESRGFQLLFIGVIKINYRIRRLPKNI
jgi:DNA-binding transcriptional ArsR family regulator